MNLIDVFNAGLHQCGQSPISATELVSPVTPVGVAIARDGVNWIQSVMRAVDWSCLRARQVLLNNGSVSLTLSSAAVGAGVTAIPASAYFQLRDVGRVLVEVGSALTGKATVTAVNNATPRVATVEVKTAFASTTLSAQGWALNPLSSWKAAYQIPSDSLKILGIADDQGHYCSHHYRHGGSPIRWDVEGKMLLTDAVRADAPNTNSSSVYPVVVYTYYEDNPDNWDELLLQAVEARIAAEMSWTTKNPKLVQTLWGLYNAKVNEGEGATREEQQRHGYPSSVLLDCRQ